MKKYSDRQIKKLHEGLASRPKMGRLEMGVKKLLMGLASRRIDFLKKVKFYFGFPKNIPNFRDEMIRVFDGKKASKSK
jgi:hypothetical protein